MSFVTSIFSLIIGNVVWDDDFSASRVLITIGKDIQKPAGDLLNHFIFTKNLMKYLWDLHVEMV